MAKHIWTVLCTRAIVDQATNTLTLADVNEEVTINATYVGEESPNPGVLPVPYRATLVTLLERSDMEVEEPSGELRLSILGPDGRAIAKGAGKFALVGGHQRARVISELDIPIQMEGRHEFAIAIPSGRAFKRVASVPVMVRIKIQKATADEAANFERLRMKDTRAKADR
jgi:hypothetical protein